MESSDAAYDAADAAPQAEDQKIPCSKRKKRSDSYGAPQVADECGVFQETDNFVPSSEGGDKGKGSNQTAEQNCKWVQVTTFKTKYHTKCEELKSSQCVMSYKTDCKDSVSYECRTEYNQECSTSQVEECSTAQPQTISALECETINEKVTEEVCTLRYEDECLNSYGLTLNCRQVPKKTCENVEKDVPTQACKTVEKLSEPQQTCVSVPKQTCKSVPQESCANVPRSDCSLVATGENCKPVPEKQCKQKAIQYPVTESKKVCE